MSEKNENRALRDLDQESLPREKLKRLGRKSLTDHELLAILLRTGTQEDNVINIASKLIQRAGSLDLLSEMEADDIVGLVKGIGFTKAVTLAAAFEIGARAIQTRASRRKLNNGDAVYDFLIADCRWALQESIWVLLLDNQLKLIRKVEISKGTVNESIAHPRDILRPAILYQASSFILAHNHPSGDPSPSEEDHRVTRRIRQAAALMNIRFLDHIIVGLPTDTRVRNYYSFRDNGFFDQEI